MGGYWSRMDQCRRARMALSGPTCVATASRNRLASSLRSLVRDVVVSPFTPARVGPMVRRNSAPARSESAAGSHGDTNAAASAPHRASAIASAWRDAANLVALRPCNDAPASSAPARTMRARAISRAAPRLAARESRPGGMTQCDVDGIGADAVLPRGVGAEYCEGCQSDACDAGGWCAAAPRQEFVVGVIEIAETCSSRTESRYEWSNDRLWCGEASVDSVDARKPSCHVPSDAL